MANKKISRGKQYTQIRISICNHVWALKNTRESKIEKFNHRYTEFIRSLLFTLSDFKSFLKVWITFDFTMCRRMLQKSECCKSQLNDKSFENHFFQKPTPYINYPTDQHFRSTGWFQYDRNPFQKGLFYRLWCCYSLIYQLQHKH